MSPHNAQRRCWLNCLCAWKFKRSRCWEVSSSKGFTLGPAMTLHYAIKGTSVKPGLSHAFTTSSPKGSWHTFQKRLDRRQKSRIRSGRRTDFPGSVKVVQTNIVSQQPRLRRRPPLLRWWKLNKVCNRYQYQIGQVRTATLQVGLARLLSIGFVWRSIFRHSAG